MFFSPEFDIINNDNNQPKSPPKSTKSRLQRKNKQRDDLHKSKFIQKLKNSFDKSDPDNTGYLTQERWNFSSLRKYIYGGTLNEEKFQEYFKKIDATSEGKVTWENLVFYLLKENDSINPHKNNDAIQFIQKSQTINYNRNQIHREMISHISISYRSNEYITVSTDSVRFWNQNDLQFIRSIVDPGLFSLALPIDCLSTIAISTTNRKLLFYDLDTLNKLPLEVSASPGPINIKNMSEKDSISKLKNLKSQNIPLYNVPTCLSLASISICDPGTVLLLIGDDQGLIEVFRLEAPKRRQGTDFKIERISRSNFHTSSITQISPISSTSYGSSSLDHTVVFWNFNTYSNTFQTIQVFKDNEPISGFYFNSLHKYLATCGISRDSYIWSSSSCKKIFRLGGHYNQVILVSNYITTTGENYILTVTNKKEFRLWDSMNYRLVKEWSDTSNYRPENKYSTGIFDEKKNSFIVTSSWPVKWCEDLSSMSDKHEHQTHNHSIIGCHFSKEFSSLVSIDSICNIKIWDIQNGKIEKSHTDKNIIHETEISSSTLDFKGRRLIISNFKNKISQWNFNSGVLLSEIEISNKKSLISIVRCYTILGRDFLILTGWDGIINLYLEVSNGMFEPYREFIGHKGDISAIDSFSNGICTGSVKGELISWSVDSNAPYASINFDSSVAVECLTSFNNFLFVGDSMGILRIYQLPDLIEIDALLGQSIYQKHSLTSLIVDKINLFLYSSDTLGYVKKWKINLIDNESIEIIPIEIYRCHYDEILSLLLVLNNNYILTISVDNCIKLFHTENFLYVGFFNDESNWLLKDQSTWKIKRNIENDPQHFVRPLKLNKTKSQIGLVKSLRNLPIFKPENEEINKQNNNKEIPIKEIESNQRVNYLELGKAIEEFYSSSLSEKPLSLQNDLEEKDNNHISNYINYPKLEISTIPNDFFNNYQKLNNLENFNKDNNKINFEKKHKLKLPIILTPKKKINFKNI